MAADITLRPVEGNDFRRGLRPMLRREQFNWWRTNRWWLQILLWLAVWDGMLAAALFVFPQIKDPSGQPLIPDDPLNMGIQLFAGIGKLGIAIAVIVLMQDAIIDEKLLGTAEWLLSKPLSRTAYILSKLIANGVGVLLTMLLIPGAVGFALFWLYEPGAVTALQVGTAVGVLGLHALFYLTLALMLGVLLQSRATLLAICFASLLGGSLVPIEVIVRISPWALDQIAIMALMGMPLGMGASMVVATAVWSVLFVAVAIWRFQRLEF